MAQVKTQPTTQSVASCLDAIDDETRRKGPISVYMAAGYDDAQHLLAPLGKHKIGKACLYINQLADVKLPVLEQLLVHAVAETKKRYPTIAKKG
jgi:hypothetical protein